MGGIDWGDAPTWVGALFAGGAAWFAFQTIKSQREQIGEQRQFIAEQSATMALERDELRAAAEERRLSQARQVVMAAELDGRQQVYDAEGELVTPVDHWRAQVTNRSTEPIRDLMVRFGEAYVAVGAVTFDESGQGNPVPVPVHLLGPGRRCELRSQRFRVTTLQNSPPTLFFTDAGGQRWRIDVHGELSEAAADAG
ncbi:hypothetical protein [Streptomyces sp. BP-8]|uniref:Uncharacterized protein n=2 Tax=Streptomyces TaxID=1883 RepID=A0ABZ2QWH7_9ACTN